MESFKPSQKHSGFGSILVIFLFVVVIALAGGAFILFRKTGPITQPTQNTATKTENSLPEWKTYTNAEAGFSLKYPTTVLLEADNKGAAQPILSVNAEKLSDIPEDLPSLMGRTDALKEKALLVKGGGETTVKIGSLYGNLGMTLSRFEVCSVILNRTLTFYPGDYRVIISLAGPEKEIMDSMPEFFMVDPANCGDKKVWNRNNLNNFEKTLANKKGAGMGQEWYDDFDAIVKTVTLTTPSVAASKPSPTAQPKSIPAGWLTYKNFANGFEISYPTNYQALDNKDALSAYPHGIILLYTGGQAYDVIIETWNTKDQYESIYASRLSDITVLKSNGKFITLLDDTHSPDNKKIIETFKLLP